MSDQKQYLVKMPNVMRRANKILFFISCLGVALLVIDVAISYLFIDQFKILCRELYVASAVTYFFTGIAGVEITVEQEEYINKTDSR